MREIPLGQYSYKKYPKKSFKKKHPKKRSLGASYFSINLRMFTRFNSKLLLVIMVLLYIQSLPTDPVGI